MALVDAPRTVVVQGLIVVVVRGVDFSPGEFHALDDDGRRKAGTKVQAGHPAADDQRADIRGQCPASCQRRRSECVPLAPRFHFSHTILFLGCEQVVFRVLQRKRTRLKVMHYVMFVLV